MPRPSRITSWPAEWIAPVVGRSVAQPGSPRFLLPPRQGRGEQRTNVVEMRRAVVVVVHEPMAVVTILGAFLDDDAHQLERRPSMMESASHLPRRVLQRAVDAPRPRRRIALPIVRAVPHLVGRQQSIGPLDNFAVQRIRWNLLGGVYLKVNHRALG